MRALLKDVETTRETMLKLGERGAAHLADADREKALLMAYLPPQLSEAEIRAIVQRLVDEAGPKLDRVMGVAQSELVVAGAGVRCVHCACRGVQGTCGLQAGGSCGARDDCRRQAIVKNVHAIEEAPCRPPPACRPRGSL